MRRLRYDLLLSFKIIFGLTDETAKNMFTLTSSLYSVNARGHAYRLYSHNSHIDIRKYLFSERVNSTLEQFTCYDLSTYTSRSVFNTVVVLNSLELRRHIRIVFYNL